MDSDYVIINLDGSEQDTKLIVKTNIPKDICEKVYSQIETHRKDKMKRNKRKERFLIKKYQIESCPN